MLRSRLAPILLAAALLLPLPATVVAQAACLGDSEPNDTPELAQTLGEAGCAEGTLPDGDQDLAVWEVLPSDATTRWTIHVEGLSGILTALKLFRVTSAPDAATLEVDRSHILEVARQPGDGGPAMMEDILLPVGRYLLGISRSALAGVEGDAAPPYRYRFERGSVVPPDADVEPNDAPGTAATMVVPGDLSGNLEGSPDYYRWEVGESDERWAVTLQGPVGETLGLEIRDPDGKVIDTVRGRSAVVSLDLDLPAGVYSLGVSPRAFEALPYVLTTSRAPAEGDAEPNDETASAIPLAAGEALVGRLAGDGDRDRYSVDVPTGAPLLRDIRLLWRSDLDRTICLLDGDEADVICARGHGGASMTALGLPAGRNIFEVRGPKSADDPYLLRLDATSAQAPDFEAEPNDSIAFATLIDPVLGMRARGSDQDKDVFRLHAEGEPQLWQIDLNGTPGSRLQWIEASGRELERGQTGTDGAVARLTDLYLVPGDHWFRVSDALGEYSIDLTPLGPPRPNGEREPNSDVVRAERYRIGSLRSGRLAVAPDVDLYRFSLAAAQHIGLQLEQPPDARTRLILRQGSETIGDLRGHAEGARLDYDLWLEPGDYLIELRPEQASEGSYRLTSKRLDPYDLGIDQEPNDGPAWAHDVPATLEWQGQAVGDGDEDWYRLPALSSSEALRVHVDDERARVRVVTPEGPARLDRADDGGYVVTEPSPLTPQHLVISADGPYVARIAGAGLEAQEPAPPLPLQLSWELEDDTVAAYWPEWQTANALMRLRNDGEDAVELSLRTRTSHHLWSARPALETLTLAAGETRLLPVEVEIGADAWADEPVQLAIEAHSADGRRASAIIDMQASPDAAPVATADGWPLPAALLGGLNVAAAALGAEPGGTVEPNFEPQLYDGVTPAGGGFGSLTREFPVELSVKLAGDEPLAVAGIILNPQAREGRLSEVPRDFELLLSTAGSEWQHALQGRLSPLPLDQAFTLDQPIDATHAMLRVTSAHSDGPRYVSLGEWKVVAVPGQSGPFGAIDVADAAVGGHIVRMSPLSPDRDLPGSIIDDETAREAIRIEADSTLEAVIGFHEARAARITSLEWVDPQPSDPDERLSAVDVWVSRLGPTGPWQPLGRWELSRSADGAVAPFVLDETAWARYVLIRGQAPADARAVELPAKLRVIEDETGDSYRSIIGEWGYTSARGPLEWLALADGLAPAPSDAGDAPDQAAAAQTLEAGVTVADRVEIDLDEDWYAIEIPPGHNTLEFEVSGRPTVRVSLELYDADGARRPLAFAVRADGTVTYQAAVEPGSAYVLRVRQPPFSAVFTFDTSSSMGPFLEIVAQGLRSFASDVRPGREAVMIVPFEDTPLLADWEDETYVLQDAVNRYPFDGGSSGAEAGLITAADLLAEREGARAILLVTDAETSTYQRSDKLWERLDRVRPMVFSVHVGAQTKPVEARHLMQDWAAAGAGHYVYPTTHGEMDRAFDRMASWLRRPADYTLSHATANVGPSTLAVVTTTEGGASGLAPGVAVEIILDTSGSMREKVGGRRRIDIARESLKGLIGETLEEGVPIAVRTFGGKGKPKKARCRSTLSLPLGPLDRRELLSFIDGLEPDKKTRTPIAAALKAVRKDLAAVSGTRSVVLVTDGAETCDGDPAAAITKLRAEGVDVTLNIVGFALEEEVLKTQMATWAEAGGGTYFDAGSPAELASSLAAALSAPFRVYGPEGKVYEGGTVGGGAIGIDPGTYRVEVLSDPIVEFPEVVVAAGQSVRLELPNADE